MTMKRFYEEYYGNVRPPIVRLGRRRRRIVYPELRGLHPVRRPKPVLYYQRSRPLRSRPRIVEDIVPYGLPIDVVPPQIGINRKFMYNSALS